MHVEKQFIRDFRRFQNQEVLIGRQLTAIAGINGTGKSTILGLLANSSQLKGHKTYQKKPYVGEFSELFSADQKHDPSGSKRLTLHYVEAGTKKAADFRTTWQKWRNKNKLRFRVIPRRDAGGPRLVESKVPSPVIYLGLSRLYPVGEADEETVKKGAQAWDVDDDRIWFEKHYRAILSVRDEVKSVRRIRITGLGRKTGTGIETATYGPAANSSGQDNLGQILMAVLSFRKLKREMGEDWDGGLLLIDELDAALHPAAQRRLLKLLAKESKAVGFQVVFTTHSSVVLRELSEKCLHNPLEHSGSIEIAYLTDANRSLEVLRNPTWAEMEADLLVSEGGTGAQVGVFSEDREAAWLAKGVLQACASAVLPRVEFIEASFSCDTLFHLYNHDYQYLKNRIVIFDGDVSQERIEAEVPADCLDSGNNVVRLPGCVRPEQVIHEYLLSLDASSDLLKELRKHSVTIRTLEEEGPLSPKYDGYDERNRYKRWFREHKDVFESTEVVSHWAKGNPEAARAFCESFYSAYNAVAKRTTVPEMPMAKRLESA